MKKQILLLTLAAFGLAGNILSAPAINPEAQQKAEQLVTKNIKITDNTFSLELV